MYALKLLKKEIETYCTITLSQSDFATVLDLSPGTICALCRGRAGGSRALEPDVYTS